MKPQPVVCAAVLFQNPNEAEKNKIFNASYARKDHVPRTSFVTADAALFF
jgi:glutamate/tyrosine decarboxylase-like PLP-dependent enzyme